MGGPFIAVPENFLTRVQTFDEQGNIQKLDEDELHKVCNHLSLKSSDKKWKHELAQTVYRCTVVKSPCRSDLDFFFWQILGLSNTWRSKKIILYFIFITMFFYNNFLGMLFCTNPLTFPFTIKAYLSWSRSNMYIHCKTSRMKQIV